MKRSIGRKPSTFEPLAGRDVSPMILSSLCASRLGGLTNVAADKHSLDAASPNCYRVLTAELRRQADDHALMMATVSGDLAAFARHLRVEGWATTASVFPPDLLGTLADELIPVSADDSARGGTRNLLDIPVVQELAISQTVRRVAEAALGEHCFAVRGILFDKTPSANWKVTWHQDLTIAVRDRRDVEGVGPWSVKEGVPHVQPPIAILERMVAVRVHLDECGPDNGPVRVIPRSHSFGRLSGEAIDVWKKEHTPIDCTVPRGGILAFYPLLLHSSSPSIRPEHRRVIHLEFAAATLPGELQWYHAIGKSISAPLPNERCSRQALSDAASLQWW